MSETYVTYLVWDGCVAPGNLEYNGKLCGQRVRAIPFDRDALLALADEMNRAADENRLTGMMAIRRARAWADRIREIVGEDGHGPGAR